MLKNHLKVALRNLHKHKGYSFINIAGLAVGIACYLIIVLFVRDESSYEKFHSSAERVIRITYLFNNLQAGVATANASSPNIVASWLKENFYEFLDREYDALYRLEQRVATLVQIFTGLAILVACFGLYGLASYSTVQRTKAIGVRKVLGATVTSIVRMLSSEIFRLIVIAFVLAAPFTFYIANKWLSDFAYRIELEWWIFGMAALAAMLMALLTNIQQSLRAALANSVEALRYEQSVISNQLSVFSFLILTTDQFMSLS